MYYIIFFLFFQPNSTMLFDNGLFGLYYAIEHPFQSGKNKTSKVIRGQPPDIAISTDVIVGFPGETKHEFLKRANHIVQCKISDIHIFKYSLRKGASATEMLNSISEHQRIRRTTMLKVIKYQAKFHFSTMYSKNKKHQ